MRGKNLENFLDLSRCKQKKTLVIVFILLNFFSLNNADPDPSPKPDPDPSPDPMPMPDPKPDPNPDPSPLPAPIMTFPDSGVYSLFPNEDLKTGKSLVRFDEERHHGGGPGGYDRLRSQGNGGNYGYGGGRDRDRERDRFNPDRAPYNRNFFDNMRNRHSRVFFDEERHRYSHDRPPPPLDSNNRYLPIGSYSPSYPNNRPSFQGQGPAPNRPNLINRPISPLHHHFQPKPLYPPVRSQSKLPARAVVDENEIPTRIHIFNPESHSFNSGGGGGGGGSYGYGTSRNSGNRNSNFIETGPPGPDLFLNHEEYLEYQRKIALARLDDEKNGGRVGGSSGSKEHNDGKKVLYEAKQPYEIDGLVPPNSSGEKKEDESSADKAKKTKILSVEVLSGEVDSANGNANGPGPSGKLSDGEKDKEVQIGDGDAAQLPSFVTNIREHPSQSVHNRRPPNFSRQIHTSRSIEDINGGFSPVIPVHLRAGSTPPISITTTSGEVLSSPSAGSREKTSNKPDTIIKLTPDERKFFSQFSNDGDGIEKHLQPADSDAPGGPTLIFLESSERTVNNSNPLATSNLIKVMRVKSTSSSSSTKSSTSIAASKANTASMILAKTGGSAEIKNRWTPTSKEKLSSLKSTDFNLKSSEDGGEQDSDTASSQRVVEKVHAHISHCPKLHAPAEVICDVHIRQRHGNPNPQLIVGWRRKFHNETHPDVLLALNKTLAYDDEAGPPTKLLGGGSAEDFHDKFNVTLAPGISPMLRSVLLIRSVTAPDCGNYQCEVFDGKYTLKSETLLFLCH